MAKIAESAEKQFPYKSYLNLVPAKDISESVSHASCVLADHLDAAAIVATTRHGFTAMQISRFRPKPKLIALSPEKQTLRRLALYWGCIPSFIPHPLNTDEHIEQAVLSASKTGKLSDGDMIVITTGYPLWESGTTNMMRVKRIGENFRS